MEGYLYKWVNYLHGWRRRYFVLHAGVLRYCAEQGSNTKGTISLSLASVIPHKTRPIKFTIDTGVTKLSLKADSPEEARQWIEALKSCKTELSEEIDSREHRSNEDDLRSSKVSPLLDKKVSELIVLEAELEELMEEKHAMRDSGAQALLSVARDLKQQTAKLLSLIEDENRNTAKLQQELERASLSPSPKKQSPFAYCAEEEESQVYHDAVSEGASIYEELVGSSSVVARSCLPVLRNPNPVPEIWNSVKDSLSLDFWKWKVPVYYSEPLSVLQRLSEDLAYADLLCEAAATADVAMRLAYVTAFAVSSYSFSNKRITRPFQALVGETFELERGGFMCIAEQVSGSTSVLSCSHPDFELLGVFEPRTSFQQGQLTISPVGSWKAALKGSTYTWTKASTVITGLNTNDVKLSHSGRLAVSDLKTNYSAYIDFERGEALRGSVLSPLGEAVFKLAGNLSKGLDILDQDERTQGTWSVDEPSISSSLNYFFSDFALQLNLSPVLFPYLPPTDSRRRPDIRALEQGDIAKMESEALRLSQSQQRLSQAPYEPRWFRQVDSEWVLRGYWEAKASEQFSGLPDIF